MNKKISIIGTVGIPSKYGGFETLVEYLTKNLNQQYDITVFCSSKSYKDKPNSHNGARLKYINLKANGLQSIFYDIISIIRSLKFADTLLILGVSGCIILPVVKLFSKKKIVVNIDGLEWKRDKWNFFAKTFLKYSEKIAVKNADIVISDNKVIKDYVESQYNKNSKLIAYGADHVTKQSFTPQLIEEYPFLEGKYAFKVCRIEPENNIRMIVEAFVEFSDLNLIIIGNWSNSKYGIGIREEFSRYKNIFLLDPIYDQNKLNQIRSNAYIYVHGHSAGGTNPSLVEAMFLGIPIIAYGINYNRETTKNQAEYFLDKNELRHILVNIASKRLQKISSDVNNIAKKSYLWEIIAREYSKLF
ncbi:DUF1972 domain-containing protein [Aquimarina sp. I32.4]|uniref:DUF1972 domain-containing protein n=1 Tax=Aquimarina sp. I32.4 TaxID=2053903 RepID=UPI000CDEA33F|nr:DUF1972 domain-containing protein [Aquimarina sp. I32.4]